MGSNCLPGFEESVEAKKCLYFSTASLTFYNAEADCSSRTNSTGHLIEFRDNATWDSIYPFLPSPNRSRMPLFLLQIN